MGFEVMALVPKIKGEGKDERERSQTKTRVDVIRTIGTERENHEPVLFLAEAVGYNMEEMCPSAFELTENLFTKEMECQYEGCGDVIECTLAEMEKAAEFLEEKALGNDNAQRALKLVDKTIKALKAGDWDKAEICFY